MQISLWASLSTASQPGTWIQVQFEWQNHEFEGLLHPKTLHSGLIQMNEEDAAKVLLKRKDKDMSLYRLVALNKTTCWDSPAECGTERVPVGISSSGWAPRWLKALKAVCSCWRSYKRLVEFFHCGANGGGLTGGACLQAQECVFVCVYLPLCNFLPEPLQPTQGSLLKLEFMWGLCVKMLCVCNFLINISLCG